MSTKSRNRIIEDSDDESCLTTEQIVEHLVPIAKRKAKRKVTIPLVKQSTVPTFETIECNKENLLPETLSQIKPNAKKKKAVLKKITKNLKKNKRKRKKNASKSKKSRKRRKMSKDEEQAAEENEEKAQMKTVGQVEVKTEGQVEVEPEKITTKKKAKQKKKKSKKKSKKKKKTVKILKKKFITLSDKINEIIQQKDQVDALSDVIIFDFETTGLSPQRGHRSIEIGAVLLQKGKITAKFQELMNPGQRIPRFIEKYTGITNEMIKTADTNKNVMTRFHKFIGNYNLVAHNASFDQKFLIAEFNLVGLEFQNNIACTLLNCRRFYFNSPNYKLGTLIDYLNIKQTGDYHRALADSEMTAYLWMKMISDMKKRYDISFLSFSMVKNLRGVPKKKVDEYWANLKC